MKRIIVCMHFVWVGGRTFPWTLANVCILFPRKFASLISWRLRKSKERNNAIAHLFAFYFTRRPNAIISTNLCRFCETDCGHRHCTVPATQSQRLYLGFLFTDYKIAIKCVSAFEAAGLITQFQNEFVLFKYLSESQLIFTVRPECHIAVDRAIEQWAQRCDWVTPFDVRAKAIASKLQQ